MRIAKKSLLHIIIKYLIACLVLSLAMALPLIAESGNEALTADIAKSLGLDKGNRWALLVGIANYPTVEGFQIQKLNAPVKDVNALANFLRDPQKGGFDSDKVFTLTEEQATKRNVLMTLNRIKNGAEPEDMVLFYFSGHGAPPDDDKTSYLIPYDHDLRDIQTTCIDFHELAEKINDMQAKKVVIIIDACHSGGVKPDGAKTAGITGYLPPDYVDTITQRFLESEGRALLLSSDESQVSLEEEDRGVFTRFLIQGLDGEADENDDGIVTFLEAATYVEEEVPKYTYRKYSRRQSPAHRHLADVERGQIPMVIRWDKLVRRKQEELLLKRNQTIFAAGLPEDIQEYSLQVVQSAHDKSIKGEELTSRESLLLEQIDKLKDGEISTNSYATRAPALYNLGMAQLQVSVTPADAAVVLSSVTEPGRTIKPGSSNSYQLESGEYRLVVNRTGYAPHFRNVTIKQGSENVNVKLEPLTGTLQLNVQPSNVNVRLVPINIVAPNTNNVKTKGLKVRRPTAEQLPIGTYRVIAEKEGYETTVREPIEIKVDASIQLTITLTPIEASKPQPATIHGSNLPVGTKVSVNGSSVTLPHSLPPGTYRIRLERNGFKTINMRKELSPNESLPLSPEWVALTGILQLQVDPSDAFIRMIPVSVVASNNEVTSTGAGNATLPVGTYSVTAEKQGYESATKNSVAINANSSTRLSLKLTPIKTAVSAKPEMGWIMGADIPSNARIFVDGKSIKLPHKIAPGKYSIRLERDGFQSIAMSKTIKSAESLYLRPQWVPMDSLAQIVGKPRISNAGAAAASLIIPGLGHHLQKRHVRGVVYEVIVAAAGIAAFVTLNSYNSKLDDYDAVKAELMSIKDGKTQTTESGLNTLIGRQDDAYDKAESARILAVTTQAVLGVIWGINAIDAGVTMPTQYGGLALKSLPNAGGVAILASLPF